MFFSYIFSAAIFIAAATADLHTSCTCHNGDSYNSRMTTVACSAYNDAKYQWGGTVYDAASGRCNQSGADSKIAGDQWEDMCKQIATSGFKCADGQGTCYAEPKEVSGAC